MKLRRKKLQSLPPPVVKPPRPTQEYTPVTLMPLEMVERGTYCKVIEKRLVVATCPLPHGTCMWKHHIHGLCTFSEQFANSEFTPAEFAARVGVSIPNSDEVNILRERIASAVRASLV